MKYIIENICLYESENDIVEIENKIFTKIIVLSEELLRVCGDLDFLKIFPENSTLTLNYNKTYQECADFYSLKTPCTIVDDIESEFYTDSDLNYEKNSPKVFNECIENDCLKLFKDIYGVSFKWLEELFFKYISQNKKICCFDKKTFFNVLHRQLGVKKGDEEIFITKFSINIDSYKNDIFNPKRDNRLYKRFLFEYQKKIYFIPIMAYENLQIIKQSFYFNSRPFFSISNSELDSLTKISNQVGKSFEDLTKNILETFDFKVFQNIKKCSINEKIIQLNTNGGEIDIIAFDLKKRICYFLECKMLNFSTESRYYLDDYNKFFEKKKGYYYKFKKKIDFFEENKNEIISYLMKDCTLDFSVEYKFITFYPCICKYVLKNYKDNIYNIELLTLFDLKKLKK